MIRKIEAGKSLCFYWTFEPIEDCSQAIYQPVFLPSKILKILGSSILIPSKCGRFESFRVFFLSLHNLHSLSLLSLGSFDACGAGGSTGGLREVAMKCYRS